MRRKSSTKGNASGKVVAKADLPSKVCVVCQRPFTWRKKWERCWDEVTTCSKSCNAKRRSNKHMEHNGTKEEDDDDHVSNASSTSNNNNNNPSTSSNDTSLDMVDDPVLRKKLLRQQHKDTVKAQKQARRQKRMGQASEEVGRKPCDLCQAQVDLLIRCTVDESQQFIMTCGTCWKTVSGGVPDGTPDHPHYRYGGVWKNRHANLKKRIGGGGKKKQQPNHGEDTTTVNPDSMLHQLFVEDDEP